MDGFFKLSFAKVVASLGKDVCGCVRLSVFILYHTTKQLQEEFMNEFRHHGQWNLPESRVRYALLYSLFFFFVYPALHHPHMLEHYQKLRTPGEMTSPYYKQETCAADT